MKMKESFLSKSFFNSKIDSVNTQKSEKWLGYFTGPCLVYMVYYAVAGPYLMQYYTDILGIGGLALTVIPFFSKFFDLIINTIMGRVISMKHTAQGKARPWILLAGILLASTGSLMYMIPKGSYELKIVWIAVSYNLFFGLGYTIYNMSHTLMVPLSTRNKKQRDELATLTSVSTSMIPGLIVTIVVPMMINLIGVGRLAQERWVTMMSIFSIIALPATLLEYYFTKERVTESIGVEEKQEEIPFKLQLKSLFTDKYWVMIMVCFAVYQFINAMSSNSSLYFCNWILGKSIERGTPYQIIVNVIGQLPLIMGAFVVDRLVKKYSMKKVSQFGFLIGAIGCLMIFIFPENKVIALIGVLIKAVGVLPTYAISTQIAGALDNIEWKNQFRADGASASVSAFIITVMVGMAQSIIFGGISYYDYILPSATLATISQPEKVQSFFVWCFAGIPMIGYLIVAILMKNYDIESRMALLAMEIEARHKEEAESRGEVYVSKEEREAKEQAELERIAEEERIEELKRLCFEKNLNFAEEEEKYQQKLAAKRAKSKGKK